MVSVKYDPEAFGEAHGRDMVLWDEMPEPRLSGKADSPHWKCVDCGVTCSCVGIVRLMPHKPCGKPKNEGSA